MQLDKHTAATNTAQNTTRQAQTQLDKHNVGGEHDVDAGAGDAGEVGLEFSHINVEGTIETEGGGEGGDDLGDEAVEGGYVGRSMSRARREMS